MNLLCPNCQKMLLVEDQYAGQMVRCPLCNNTIPVPALPPTVAPISLAPLAPVSQPTPVPQPAAAPTLPGTSPAGNVQGNPDVYSVTPALPTTTYQPNPEPLRERPKKPDPAPALPNPGPEAKEPPPPLAGYTHMRTIELSPRVVPWIAPVALALLFIVLCFPWVGRYSLQSTEPVVQSGWGNGFWGEFTGLGLLHNVLYILVLPLALATVLVPLLNLQLPPQVQAVWPKRTLILGGAVLVLFLILSLEMLTGFGLESAAVRPTEPAKAEAPKEGAPSTSVPRDVEARFAKLTLYRTAAPYLALLLELAALVGVALDLWLQRRGNRALPKMELAW
jgi:hypothetical protein